MNSLKQMSINTHGLELVRSDMGDGGWSLHDAEGKLRSSGPATWVGDPHYGEWNRPNQADFDAAKPRHYRIQLDASYDLWSAGFLNDEEQIEAFVRAYASAAEKIGEKRDIDITIDIAPASMGGHGDTDDEAMELWQEIHDEVSWDGPRR